MNLSLLQCFLSIFSFKRAAWEPVPKTEKVVQEFWDYDRADREKARNISGEFLKRRLDELQNPKGKKK